MASTRWHSGMYLLMGLGLQIIGVYLFLIISYHFELEWNKVFAAFYFTLVCCLSILSFSKGTNAAKNMLKSSSVLWSGVNIFATIIVIIVTIVLIALVFTGDISWQGYEF